MKTPNPHVDPFVVADPFVEALRGDLPSAADEARVRARLLAAGVAMTGAALSTSSAASPFGAATGVASGTVGAVPGGVASGAAVSGAAVSGAAVSGAAVGGLGAGAAGGSLAAGAPAALVKAGLLSKLLLPVAAKVGVAATLAVAVAATSVPLVLRHEAPREAPTARATPAGDERMARFPMEKGLPAARELAPELPSRGGAEVPALDLASPRAGSETAATSGHAAAASGAPTDGSAVPPPRPAAVAAPKAARGAGVTSARPRRVSPVVAGRSSADEPSAPTRSELSAPAPGARDGSEGRTELVRSSSLGEETRLMERAMVALGEGDRELARRSLEEHARRFPGGLLQRERERALERLRQADAEQPATGSSR
jgi:hypothetical protein